MPLTLQELKSHLWNCAEILRGSAVDRTDWKAYILPLLFFKRICDVWDEETTEAAELYGDVDPVDYPEVHRFCRTSSNSPPRAPNNSPPGLVAFVLLCRTSLGKFAALSRPPPRPVALALHVHVEGRVHEPVEDPFSDHRVGKQLIPVLR
jgi:hypothetical protein